MKISILNFCLLFMIILIFINNEIICKSKENNLNEQKLFNFNLEEEMNYIEFYACLNQDEFDGNLMNNNYKLSVFNKDYNSDILFVCNKQINIDTRYNLMYLLNSLQDYQIETLNFQNKDIEFSDI